MNPHPSARAVALATMLILMVPTLGSAVPSIEAAEAKLDPNLLPHLDAREARIGTIIQYVDAPTDADAQRLLKVGFLPGMIRYTVVDAIYAEGPASAVRAIARDPRVLYVEHDESYEFTMDRATQAVRANEAWTAEWLGIDGVHTGGITGRGIGVAIVDSGVDATHPDLLWGPAAQAAGLQPKTVGNYKLVGRDSVELTRILGLDPLVEAAALAVDMPNTDTTGGHGTHIAGSVGGNGFASDGKIKGAAPGADLVGFGAGETLLIHLGLAAFDWIHLHHEKHNIRIVSNSWGGPGDWNPDRAVTKAIRKLANEDGMLMVFAAGNAGGGGSTIQTSLWGNIPEALSVANYYDRTGWLDDSSSRGMRSLPHTWPDVAAPGTQIVSTAAVGGPVAWYGTSQDALIAYLDNQPEPVAVPAPSPVLVEADGATVGWYSSMTGTSMATPVVSGVAALVLEANPALTWQEVRTILRETANMPAGRTHEADGFAVGRGVVDAVEAVAVALRTRDGMSLERALALAYVDLDGPVARLNFEAARHLDFTGAALDGGDLAVSGMLRAGGLTDQRIPLAPEPVPVVDGIVGTPRIYQPTLTSSGGGADPFFFGLRYHVPAGMNVTLRLINIHSTGSLPPADIEDLVVRHVVSRDGIVVSDTQANLLTGSMGVGSRSQWTADVMGAGEYVFDAYATVPSTGATYHAAALEFTVVGPPALSTPAAAAAGYVDATASTASTTVTLFSEGFEDGDGAWTKTQKGSTNWFTQDQEGVGSIRDAQEGARYEIVANPLVIPVVGPIYDDNANATLLSPPIDLRNLASAEVGYWRAGGSEKNYDVLTVSVVTEAGAPVVLEKLSGSATPWTHSTYDLAPFLGETVRLQFRFTSDVVTFGANKPGWAIDNILVTGTVGGGPFLVPSLTAKFHQDVDALAALFTYSAVTDGSVRSFTLDFGDGSPVLVSPGAGAVVHWYEPGWYVATLTVETLDGRTATTTVDVDSAANGVVQVRFGGQGPWTDAAAATGLDDVAWSATLPDAAGPVLVEVRHRDAEGRELRLSQVVEA